MKEGWFIGNFEPSLLKTTDFEVGVKHHPKGSYWQDHYHRHTTEYNLLIEGKMILNGNELSAGDLFVIAPYEVSCSTFVDDCTVLVVKTPSIPEDKVNIKYD